jgi:cytochrome c-type biogenesis protein CcmH
MSEWWLVSLLVVLALFASTVIVYPLRHYRIAASLVAPLMLVLVAVGYYFWGGFSPWHSYLHHNDTQELAQRMLKTIKTPQELISRLKAKLNEDPSSAKGWYLLGRLYASQNDTQHASEAFFKAHHFEPDNEQYTVNYAHSLWEINKQVFSPEILDIFHSLLQKNPNQADALAMLAMDAFMSHAYADAIDYWQRLLKLAPPQSEESLAIRKAIAKAEERINLERESK